MVAVTGSPGPANASALPHPQPREGGVPTDRPADHQLAIPRDETWGTCHPKCP